MAIGDLNGDGVPDMAVANSDSNTVSVLMGNDDGSFGPRRDYGTGNGPCSVALGDLNGDGVLDVATADAASGTVSVRMGNGDGTFGSRTGVTGAAVPRTVAIGDLTGDGIPDLAVGDDFDGEVWILCGREDGTYDNWGGIGGGLEPTAVLITDLNGDGVTDIVITWAESDLVLVAFNAGTGAFEPWEYLHVDPRPSAVAVGDLNGDGRPDLAIACEGSVSLLFGNGHEGFDTAAGVEVPAASSSIALGDLNGDGKLDLVVTFTTKSLLLWEWDTYRTQVFLGNGDGTFGDSRDFGAGPDPSAVAVRDVDLDGKLDVVIANRGSNSVWVMLGNGDGTLRCGLSFASSGYSWRFHPWSIAGGDLDDNGTLDLVVATSGPMAIAWPLDFIEVFSGSGSGGFTSAGTYGVAGESMYAAVADFNADGHLDVATAFYDGVDVRLGDGAGGFGDATVFPTPCCQLCVATADLNGDGRLDLVTSGSALLGNGDGTFGTSMDFSWNSENRSSVAVGDFDHDGIPDLALADEGSNILSVLPGHGDGTFGSRRDYVTTNIAGSVAVGDLNGDGHLDLATAGGSVLLGLGDGSFGAATCLATKGGGYAVAIADVDDDGRPDLILANTWANTLSVWFGGGSGLLAGRIDYGTGNYPCSLMPGDVNGDGRLDLVAGDWQSGRITVLLNQGPGTAAVVPAPPVAAQAFRLVSTNPNPTRGASEVRFVLPAACKVDVTLFDLAGRKVRSLIVGEPALPGEHKIAWDGRDASGARVHAGVYLVQVRAGGDVGTRRLVVLQ